MPHTQNLNNLNSARIKRGLRSEASLEIVSQRPDVIIRWGTSFFVLILCLILAVCWIIKYPEIIRAPTKLTCINAPKRVINVIRGKLTKLGTEGERVKTVQIFDYMESTNDPQDVIGLPSHLDSIQNAIGTVKFDEIQQYITSKLVYLGELQTSYEVFLQSFLSLSDYLPNGFYLRKRQKLHQDLQILFAINGYFLEQKQLQMEDVELTERTFEAIEKLNYEKVISEFEYRKEKSKVLNKKLTLPLIKVAFSENKYLAKINLTNGLQTNYGKDIHYRNGLKRRDYHQRNAIA